MKGLTNFKKFHCPECGADLRKVGVEVHEWGRQVLKFKFTRDGKYDSEELIDGETEDYSVYCGNCKAELVLDYPDLFEKLPEVIETL